ncbi:MAG: NADH-quinone oxidoreductase subunit M [Phycisphaerales bacterium]|nr:NADH-quinone oxidoreductase subunit M [Phycisphaerales bacterium]
MMLLMLIAMPLMGALLIAAAPESRTRAIATIGSLAPVAWFAWLCTRFNWHGGGGGMQFEYAVGWFRPLGVTFTVGVDSVAMLLIGLTVLLGPICVIGSYTAISDRIRTYYGWLLVLQAAMTGVFCARDVILFYIFFEFTLVPMYILINLYGSTNRKAAATKFFLYTFTGSLFTLAGLVYVAYRRAAVSGEWTFGFEELAQTCRMFTASEQAWVFWAMLAGFAVKVPLFPVHTWLPLAHTEAPTAGSVVLAGVLLKLGTYGLYRFVLQFCPVAAIEFAPLLAIICCIGILYAGLICWVQTDVKKLVAYSSVSHLGFCILGLFALNATGLQGSVLYMINHGLSTGALFLMIGMMYERYHTRNMKELSGLAAKMPVWATFMVIFTMASVGLPGTNGFVSEFMCLFGAFQAGGAQWKGLSADGSMPVGGTLGVLGPYIAMVAGTGMIVTAIYLLYMLGRVVWGPLVEPAGHGHGHGGHGSHGHDPTGHKGGLPTDLGRREIALLVPLAALCIGIGLYPSSVLETLREPTRATASLMAETMNRMDAPKSEPAGKPVAGVEGGSESVDEGVTQ